MRLYTKIKFSSYGKKNIIHSNLMAFFLVLSFGLFAGQTLLAQDSPVGKWKTTDDKTGQPKSIVEIFESGGKLNGKVLELINPPEPDPKCEDCPGEAKNKPIKGLKILWDMEKNGNEWKGGKILDPESGKVYKCLMRLKDGGGKLEVRGFIGFSLIGRSQTWSRAN